MACSKLRTGGEPCARAFEDFPKHLNNNHEHHELQLQHTSDSVT